jgi:outer membrane receptor protein involved in Fe transport
MRLALDWAHVELKGGISPLDIERQMQVCYDSNTFPNDACAGFHRYTAAEIAGLPPGFPERQVGDLANGYQATYFNVATIEFEGLILASEIDFDLGPGAMRAGATVFYTNKFEETLFAGDEPVDSAGLLGEPEYTAQLNLGYHWKSLDVDWQTLWRSSVKTGINVDPEEYQATHVPSYATHNLTFGYRISDSLRAQLGVSNVLDEDIPTNALVNGFSGYDPLGRRYFMTLFADFH